jgi:antitoxin component of RelBE/YafQ-DinJ toxin-antitoxin module
VLSPAAVLQAMLEEDALRFDAFLKENDEKVQEAIKHADTEAKAKQDKVRAASCSSSQD